MPAIALPAVFNDGDGYRWDIQQSGYVLDGTSDAYNYGMYLNSFTITDLLRKRRITGVNSLSRGISTATASLALTRKIYVSPDEGWARYLEVVTNDKPYATKSRYRC